MVKRAWRFGLLFILIPLLAFMGCKADLTVRDLNVTWDDVNKKASAEIANIGNKDAGNFMVYFNADENPVSPNRRPQVRFNIPSMAKGASTTLEADFAPLAHPDNSYLANVFKITVLVDPKSTVDELNEDNNTAEAPIH